MLFLQYQFKNSYSLHLSSLPSAEKSDIPHGSKKDTEAPAFTLTHHNILKPEQRDFCASILPISPEASQQKS